MQQHKGHSFRTAAKQTRVHIVTSVTHKHTHTHTLPSEVVKAPEGHHGAHPLTGRRQLALQEELTALTRHRIKLPRPARRQPACVYVCVCIWVKEQHADSTEAATEHRSCLHVRHVHHPSIYMH